MKKVLFLAMLGLVIASPSYAISFRDSTNKTMLNQPINNVGFLSSSTIGGNGTLISIPGTPITGIMLSGGSSGGVVSIYDANVATVAANAVAGGANTVGSVEVGNPECVFEATVGSNTQNFVDLSASPINTNNGIVVVTSSTAGVVVYTGSGTTNR